MATSAFAFCETSKPISPISVTIIVYLTFNELKCLQTNAKTAVLHHGEQKNFDFNMWR